MFSFCFLCKMVPKTVLSDSCHYPPMQILLEFLTPSKWGKAKESGIQTVGLKLQCDFSLCFLSYHFSRGIKLSCHKGTYMAYG